jgi:hypothetical protein
MPSRVVETVNQIVDEKAKAIITEVLQIIEERRNLRRDPSKYSEHDKDVVLELDVLELKILRKFKG